MLRPAWLRAFAAIWAVWLQAALLDPGAFDRCPEHARTAAATQIATHGHAAHEHGSPADRHQHSCTCLGTCCCAAPVAVPATTIDVPLVAAIEQAPLGEPDVRVVVELRPHSLPFANGPPSSPVSAA